MVTTPTVEVTPTQAKLAELENTQQHAGTNEKLQKRATAYSLDQLFDEDDDVCVQCVATPATRDGWRSIAITLAAVLQRPRTILQRPWYLALNQLLAITILLFEAVVLGVRSVLIRRRLLTTQGKDGERSPNARRIRHSLSRRPTFRDTTDESGFAQVGEGRGDPATLWYCVTGKGPVRVLTINGLGRNAQDSSSIQEFSREKLRVVAYDSRFVGLSSRQSALFQGRLTTASLADDALDLLKHLGWDDGRGIHIVGSSGGGMVAQELCLRAPASVAVRSLSLCVTYAGGSLSSILPPALFRLPTVAKALSSASQHGGIEGVARSNLVMIGGAVDEGEKLDAEMERQRQRARELGAEMGSPVVEVAGLLRHTGACAGHYMGPERLAMLRALDFPKCVYGASELDLLVQHTNSPPLAAAIGATLRMYAGAGHDLSAEPSREAFLHDLVNFIERADC